MTYFVIFMVRILIHLYLHYGTSTLIGVVYAVNQNQLVVDTLKLDKVDFTLRRGLYE